MLLDVECMESLKTANEWSGERSRVKEYVTYSVFVAIVVILTHWAVQCHAIICSVMPKWLFNFLCSSHKNESRILATSLFWFSLVSSSSSLILSLFNVLQRSGSQKTAARINLNVNVFNFLLCLNNVWDHVIDYKFITIEKLGHKLVSNIINRKMMFPMSILYLPISSYSFDDANVVVAKQWWTFTSNRWTLDGHQNHKAKCMGKSIYGENSTESREWAEMLGQGFHLLDIDEWVNEMLFFFLKKNQNKL